MIVAVKIVAQVKLVPDAVEASAIERTLLTINAAANGVSVTAFEKFGLRASVRDLRSLCYGKLKTQGFGAQVAQHVIKRVVDAMPLCGRASGRDTSGVSNPRVAVKPSPSQLCSALTRRTPMTTDACHGITTVGP
jgi:hypothetical protein